MHSRPEFLLETDESFRLLVESVKDYAIYLLDPQGRVASWNVGAERIKGYTAQEIVGSHFSRFYPAEDVASGKPERELLAALQHGRAEDEGWRVRKDGSRFWASVVVTALYNDAGRLLGFAKITRDLTERRQAEDNARQLEREQLARQQAEERARERREHLERERAARLSAQAAEQRLAFLAEAGMRLSSSLDYETTLRSVAALAVPRLADWCSVDLLEDGKLRNVAVAHKDPEKVRWAKELQERYPADLDAPTGVPNVLRTGRTEFYPEIPDELLVRATKDEEHLRIARAVGFTAAIVAPLRIEDRTFGALSLVSAESGRRYGPEDVALAEELAARVALAVDRARLYRDALEGVRLREDFLTIATHELKTPLAAMQLQLDGIQRITAELPAAATQRMLKRVRGAQRQAARLERLVSDLLDASRLSAGRLTLEPAEVDLARLAREVSARLSDQAARAGCEVKLQGPAPVLGRWDPMRLEQILANLLGNAFKYGPRQPIEVTLSCDGDWAGLSVRDHGIGIDPEHQGRIFERFERAVSAQNYGGFGVGLWIVKQLVEVMGGTIGVESRPGDGATFLVRLPRWR